MLDFLAHDGANALLEPLWEIDWINVDFIERVGHPVIIGFEIDVESESIVSGQRPPRGTDYGLAHKSVSQSTSDTTGTGTAFTQQFDRQLARQSRRS